ncbi:dTMP kinase [candidate division KSB1 bacterium]|nr:dTMP kinase [candidate division KSB1 bacterium]
MTPRTSTLPELFITFEGIDFCGKSTQISLFYKRLQSCVRDCLLVRDPGGNAISEKIRHILLDPGNTQMAAWTELLLYEAARAQMVQEQILPALRQKSTVVCDRFFDSTTAYQGYGRGLDALRVEAANRLGSCGLTPGLTFVIDLEPEKALARKVKSRQTLDRMESEGLEFQHRVREGFLEIARREPERLVVVDGDRSIEDIQSVIWDRFNRVFPTAHLK